jgi:hypothetical protein
MLRADTGCDCVRSAMIGRMITAMLFSVLVIPTAFGLVHVYLLGSMLATTTASGKQPQ